MKCYIFWVCLSYNFSSNYDGIYFVISLLLSSLNFGIPLLKCSDWPEAIRIKKKEQIFLDLSMCFHLFLVSDTSSHVFRQVADVKSKLKRRHSTGCVGNYVVSWYPPDVNLLKKRSINNSEHHQHQRSLLC